MTSKEQLKKWSDREDEIEAAARSTLKPSDVTPEALDRADETLSRAAERHEEDLDDRLLRVLDNAVKKKQRS